MKAKGISLLLTFIGCTLLAAGVRAQNPIPEFDIIPEPPKAANLGTYGIPSQPVHSSIAQSNYFNNFSKLSQQQQHQQIMREVDQHLAQQAANQRSGNQIINEALAAYEEDKINYTLKGRNIPGREIFHSALNELQAMLKGEQELSIKKAVFLSEYAYDPSLSWQHFEKSIDDMVSHVGQYMRSQGYDSQDNSAKNLALYNFFTDTLTVHYQGKEDPVSSYPLFYDFEDFWGRNDASKMFVSKLIKDGTGQCHSLPLLFLILAEEMNAKAHLAFAPNHSYIKFQDKLGDWHNIELTTQSLTSDQFIMQTGFIKSSAIANKIYMNPLTEKEVVAQSVNDLMMAYVRKFGFEDFVLQGTSVALTHADNSITAHLINHNYYQGLLQHIIRQYKQKGKTEKQLNEDEKAQYVFKQMMGSRELIDGLGHANMPADMYEAWLRSVDDEGRKQEHRNKMRTLMGQIGNY